MNTHRIPPTLGSRVAGNQSLVRDLNLRAVYELITLEAPTSRTEVARHLGLSAAAVGRIVDVLLGANLVEEGERINQGVGRPQTMLHATSDAACIAGVSIRSRSLRAYLADLDGTVLATTRVDRNDESPEALARQVAETLDAMSREKGKGRPIASVTIGLSAVWNESERRVYAAPNLTMLEGVDARGLFMDALTDVLLEPAIGIDNDVNLAALGEFATGSAIDVHDFFYLSLGSGVGGAAVVNGVVQHGASGFAGEIGHIPIHAEGRLDRLESFLARDPLIHFLQRHDVHLPEGSTAIEHLVPTVANHPHLVATITRMLGQAFVSVITTLDPNLIVLGGSLGRHLTPWIDPIRDHVSHYVPETPPITVTSLGREASLIGALASSQALARDVLVRRIGIA